MSPGWYLAACVIGITCGVVAALVHRRRKRNPMKNRKKHDPLNYYANLFAAQEAAHKAALRALDPTHGGYRGGTEAHRAGAPGSSIHGASNSSGGRTGARMSITEFSGIDQIIEPALEEAGFAVGVVRGVRSFNVDTLGRLTGVTYKQVWRPGENVAECKVSDYPWPVLHMTLSYTVTGAKVSTSPPADRAKPHALRDCKHGFYGYYDGSNDYYDKGRVSAVIEGYGETVIGSRGFRCMKARIVALHIPEDVKPHLARLVVRNYPDIPILETFEQMVSEFPPDSAGNEVTPDTDPDFWTRPA